MNEIVAAISVEKPCEYSGASHTEMWTDSILALWLLARHTPKHPAARLSTSSATTSGQSLEAAALQSGGEDAASFGAARFSIKEKMKYGDRASCWPPQACWAAGVRGGRWE